MKNSIITALLFVFALAGCEKKAEVPQYEIYENHDISACGISDPLQNIEWLKEYCQSINKTREFLSVYVNLYNVVGKENENIFYVRYSTDGINFISSQLYCINCNSDTIFHFGWLMGKGNFYPELPPLPLYYEFMKDKEFVAELFHFVKH